MHSPVVNGKWVSAFLSGFSPVVVGDAVVLLSQRMSPLATRVDCDWPS